MVKKNWVRNFTSFFSILAILTATSAVALAFSDKNSAKGEIIVAGNSDGNGAFVMLDGQKAYNGRTFISSGIIKTEEKGATVKLNGLGLVKLAPNSTLNLSISDNNISGTLTDGKVKVFNKKGVTVNIETADSKISNDGTQKNIFDVDLSSGKTLANAEIGSIFLKTGENTTVVAPRQDDDDDDDTNVLPLVLVFAGIVGLSAYLVLSNRSDGDDLQTISATF